MSTRCLVPLLLIVSACTTLGPMPATTGISAVPANRPGVELQAGLMPAYFLSDSAKEQDTNDTMPTQQIAALLEPDRLLGTKGLIVGARSWGDEGDTQLEPMIGVRRRIDDRFAVAGVAYGTRTHGGWAGDASYSAFRAGGELAIDSTLIPLASWLAVHVQASVSATYLDAEGTYCVSASGEGTDCDDKTRRVDGTIEGIYTSATAGVSVDIGRRPHGTLHGIRLALIGAVGAMPRIRNGVQEQSADRYQSIGLSMTIGFGDDH
jgi:hypothetical protein